MTLPLIPRVPVQPAEDAPAGVNRLALRAQILAPSVQVRAPNAPVRARSVLVSLNPLFRHSSSNFDVSVVSIEVKVMHSFLKRQKIPF